MFFFALWWITGLHFIFKLWWSKRALNPWCLVSQNRHRKHLFAVIFVLPAACRARWISNLSWLRNLFLQILQRPTCDFHLFLQAFLQWVFLLEISNCDCCSTWVKFKEFEVCLSIPKLNRALPSGCRTQVAWEKNSSCGISLPASSKKRLEKGSRKITNCPSLKRSRGTLAVPWKLPHLHKNWIVRGRRHKNQSIISS